LSEEEVLDRVINQRFDQVFVISAQSLSPGSSRALAVEGDDSILAARLLLEA
jgi:hypothetical protein